MGVSASIISNTGGQYYKLTFPSVGKAITPVTVNVMDDGSARKLTTIGRLLYVSQEIYIKKEGVKLIRLGKLNILMEMIFWYYRKWLKRLPGIY